MKTKITLKTAIKAKKCFNKKLKDFLLGKKRKQNKKLMCFSVVLQSAYVGCVGLVGKNLESYVEMVAGLPINKQI